MKKKCVSAEVLECGSEEVEEVREVKKKCVSAEVLECWSEEVKEVKKKE